MKQMQDQHIKVLIYLKKILKFCYYIKIINNSFTLEI